MGERPDVTLRLVGGPDRVDMYGHPAPPRSAVLGRPATPVFVTVPKPPFDPARAVPQGLAFRYGASDRPSWREVSLRHRGGTALGYFERTALASVRFHRAAYLLAVGQVDSARAEVELARGLAHDNVGMLGDLGTLLAFHGRFADAEGLWRAAIALDPRHSPAWENLVQARLRQGDPAGARAVVDEALEHLPDHAALRSLRERLRRR
jgi:tetratricopeptide (TPR) repeat protein